MSLGLNLYPKPESSCTRPGYREAILAVQSRGACISVYIAILWKPRGSELLGYPAFPF